MVTTSLRMTGRVRLASLAFVAACLLFQGNLLAQEEVTSKVRRYKLHEQSTGYYEEYEVMPRRQRPFIRIPGLGGRSLATSPTGAQVRNRYRLADSHQGLEFYERRRCESCHPQQAQDLHTKRANLTCRQCHSSEPIPSILFYFSNMNPIRRHAYVCAKCHQGASPSFATYVVHQPGPGSPEAKATFPSLYYISWFMLLLLAGTLLFFIPHSFLLGLRELLDRKKKEPPE